MCPWLHTAEVYASLQIEYREGIWKIYKALPMQISSHKRCMYSIIDIENDDSFTSIGIAFRTIFGLYGLQKPSRSYYHQD